VDEPRWLSDGEQRVWRSLIDAIRVLNGRLDADLMREAGMPHAYYIVLVVLADSPDRRRRMTELADLTSSSRSRLSHAVARMVEYGWLTREECADDRRGWWARLTDRGFAALAAAAPGHVETVRQAVFDRLTDDQVRALGEITDALRKPSDSATG
jgi:DNA-binding MarR family transcriptional regulator